MRGGIKMFRLFNNADGRLVDGPLGEFLADFNNALRGLSGREIAFGIGFVVGGSISNFGIGYDFYTDPNISVADLLARSPENLDSNESTGLLLLIGLNLFNLDAVNRNFVDVVGSFALGAICGYNLALGAPSVFATIFGGNTGSLPGPEAQDHAEQVFRFR